MRVTVTYSGDEFPHGVLIETDMKSIEALKALFRWILEKVPFLYATLKPLEMQLDALPVLKEIKFALGEKALCFRIKEEKCRKKREE